MQFSLPVISTYWRGIPEILLDGESGYLVKPKSRKDLENKLIDLIESDG